jgi:hypothetical protein
MDFSQELIDYYNSLGVVSIVLYPETRMKEIASLEELYSFIKKENEFWQQYNIYATSRVYDLIKQTSNYLNTAINNNDKVDIENAIKTLRN